MKVSKASFFLFFFLSFYITPGVAVETVPYKNAKVLVGSLDDSAPETKDMAKLETAKQAIELCLESANDDAFVFESVHVFLSQTPDIKPESLYLLNYCLSQRYISQGEFQHALTLLLALNTDTAINIESNIKTKFQLAKLYLQTNQAFFALEFFEQIQGLAIELEQLNWLIDSHVEQAKIYASMLDLDKAKWHFEQLKTLTKIGNEPKFLLWVLTEEVKLLSEYQQFKDANLVNKRIQTLAGEHSYLMLLQDANIREAWFLAQDGEVERSQSRLRELYQQASQRRNKTAQLKILLLAIDNHLKQKEYEFANKLISPAKSLLTYVRADDKQKQDWQQRLVQQQIETNMHTDKIERAERLLPEIKDITMKYRQTLKLALTDSSYQSELNIDLLDRLLTKVATINSEQQSELLAFYQQLHQRDLASFDQQITQLLEQHSMLNQQIESLQNRQTFWLLVIVLMLAIFTFYWVWKNRPQWFIQYYLNNSLLANGYLTKLPVYSDLINKLESFEQDEKAYSMIMLGLDDFKVVNEKLGAEAADRILLYCFVSWQNLIPKTAYLARYSGDVFVVVCRGYTFDQTRVLADRLRMELNISSLLAEETQSLKLTASCCVAESSTQPSYSARITEVEHALSRAKLAGKNRTTSV